MSELALQHASFLAPLTAAQLGIWLGQQLNSASSMYNAAEFIELRGVLNVNLFTRALSEVIAETVTLNLIFEQTPAGPQQRVQTTHWQLAEQDFSHCAAPFEQARQWMYTDLARTVDLTTDPVFNQALIKLGEDHHFWYQRIHHIASDGFGFALITQAVAERYNALQSTQVPEKEFQKNPDIQLTAFQRILDEDANYTASTAAKKDQEFWLAQLADNPFFKKTLSPVDIADTSIRISSHITSVEFVQLQSLATQLEIAWSELLIASVAQLIHQHTAATDITLGLPVMNRMGSASLRIPAMVMNIIPLRIRFQPNGNFSALAQQINTQLKACRPHQRYRYEQLKRDCAITGQQRLFGPVINIMPFDRPLDFANLQAQVHNLSAGPVEDISFAFVLDKTGGLRVDMDANPNSYSHQQLQDIQQDLLQLLEQIQHTPQLPVLPNATKLSWLEGKALTPQPSSVMGFIYQQIQQYPQAIALQHEQIELTYSALAEQSATMALAICDMDIVPGSIIALILPRGDLAITAALACLLIDCTFVFIDHAAPPARNQLILQDSQPNLVIVERITAELNSGLLSDANPAPLVTPQYLLHHNKNIAAQTSRADINKLWQQASQTRSQQVLQQAPQKQQNPAYLIYTSGSTGTPKGVAVGHKALAEFVASNQDSYSINANDRVLQFAPLHFDACIEEIFVSLSVGARIVIRNSEMLESMPAFIAQCDEWKISVLDLPTAFWHEFAYACTQLKLELPKHLRTIIIGGEAVLAERVAQWRACYGDKIALFNTYGPSETTVIATCTNLCTTNAVLHNAPISIGEPLSGRALAVVDAQLNPLPKGEEGELLLLGAGLAEGYLHLPEKTAEAFINIQFPWFEQPERAYRTGDRVKINSANQVEFIGRLDDQIKISGYRIDPFEIEAALVKLPNIEEVVVVAVTATDGHKFLVAHLASNQPYTIQELRSLLNAHLPAPMLPSQRVIHEKLPKNSSGKIDKKYLQRLSQDAANKIVASPGDDNSKPVQDFTVGQQLIASIWQQVLGQKSIALDDDFFALGGQSLQTIQVANRLATQLERNIPVALLFQNPTIKSLSYILFNQEEQNNQTLTNATAAIQESMRADCIEFEKSLPPASNGRHVQMPNAEQTILLTGATGFVGAQLLHQLLIQSSHAIICAVRAPSEGTAYQRLHKALAQQGLSNDDLHRVQVQLVDLEQPRLGLTATAFANLANKVTAIIHNAANTSVMRDYQSLRAANALSTGELLKLAAVNAIPFHLISTIAVVPHNTQAPENSTAGIGGLGEHFIAAHSGLRDGYQQSKWVAEQMAAIAQQKGYAINVYRLARVTGAADSGYVNPKDLVWSILQAGLPIGALPELDISEPWTPVDKIAQFVVQHSLAKPGEGVFNLTPEHPLSFAQLYQWLAEAGAVAEIKPLSDWCSLVKQQGRPQDQAIVEFFLQRSAHAENHSAPSISPETISLPAISLPVIQNQRFKQLAEKYGTAIPAITQSLFNHYFSYATGMGWFSADQTQHETTQPHTYNQVNSHTRVQTHNLLTENPLMEGLTHE